MDNKQGKHHHHHHRQEIDASEIEKISRLNFARRRKIFAKALLIIMSITAAIVVSWVVWAYSYS